MHPVNQETIDKLSDSLAALFHESCEYGAFLADAVTEERPSWAFLQQLRLDGAYWDQEGEARAGAYEPSIPDRFCSLAGAVLFNFYNRLEEIHDAVVYHDDPDFSEMDEAA